MDVIGFMHKWVAVLFLPFSKARTHSNSRVVFPTRAPDIRFQFFWLIEAGIQKTGFAKT